MEIIIVKLLLAFVSTTISESIGETDLTGKVVESLTKTGLKISEDTIGKLIKDSKDFKLNQKLKNCGISCEKEVCDFIKEFLNNVDVLELAKENGGIGDAFINTLIVQFDTRLCQNAELLDKIGNNYEQVKSVFETWAKHVWAFADKENIILEKMHFEHNQMMEILKKIIEILDELLLERKETVSQEFPNRYQEYKNKWDENLFLNDPDEYDETTKVSIKLSDLYIVPSFIWEQNKKASDDINGVLERTAKATKPDKRMLVILGQPGSGKSSLITYFLNMYDGKLDREILLYRFTDFKKIDWNSDKVVDQFLEQIHMRPESLTGKILILDGFDEIYARNGEDTLNQLRSGLANNSKMKDFALFVTCRENYIKAENLKCNYITIQSLNKKQIEDYYNTYREKSQSAKMKIPLDILLNNKDIFGIPIVLYMTLASNIEAGTESTIVDIYDKIFDLQNGKGLYDIENYKEEVHRVWLSDNKSKVHEASRKIAIWMYQQNEGKEVILQEEFESIIENVGMDANEIKIGNFFKHCEGTEGEAKTSVCFVHRSIYQYFVADAICAAVEKEIKNSTDENRKVFIKNIVPFVKVGELDPTICKYLKYKFEKVYGIKKEKSVLFLWLEDVLLEAMEEGFVKISDTVAESFLEYEKLEMNCFSNLLIILYGCSSWNIDRHVMFGKCIDKLVLYIKHNGIIATHSWCLYNFNLEGVNLAGVNLENVNLSNANLKNVTLEGANMKGVNLSNANLSNVILKGANMKGANLSDANLSDMKFGYADLRNVSLKGSNLSDVDMQYVNLRRADFRNVNLSEVNLSDAFLRLAIFRDANFRNVNLKNAYLRHTDLRCTNLINVDLSDAFLEECFMTKADYTEGTIAEFEKRGVVFR